MNDTVINQMVYPMFALVIFKFLYTLAMAYQRVQSVKKGQVDGKFFKTYDLGQLPRKMAQVSRHYTNLYEQPVLFYAGCLTIIVLERASTASLILAWSFVGARLLHAFIHTGKNRIYPRIGAFLLSWLILLGLWICAICPGH